MQKVNWGIIGLGRIAHEFALSFNEVSNANLLSVASQDHDRLDDFKKKFNLNSKYSFPDYRDLINCNEVDIIYIALPHSLHFEWIVNCLNANKNVLTEKPATINLSEIKKINKILDYKKVFFAEGFMYRFNPQTVELINIIKKKKIGKLLKMESFFGNNIAYKKNLFGKLKLKTNLKSRLFDKNLGGGAILDLGCYPVSLSVLIASLLENSKNTKIELLNKNIEYGPSEVDLDSYADIKFSNNFVSSIGCSFTKDLGQKTKIYGSSGEIYLEKTWRSQEPIILVNGIKKKFNLPKYKNIFSYEVESISNNIINGELEPSFPGLNRFDTEKNMEIIENWLN